MNSISNASHSKISRMIIVGSYDYKFCVRSISIGNSHSSSSALLLATERLNNFDWTTFGWIRNVFWNQKKCVVSKRRTFTKRSSSACVLLKVAPRALCWRADGPHHMCSSLSKQQQKPAISWCSSDSASFIALPAFCCGAQPLVWYWNHAA